jgi:mycothione reductase
MKTYDVIVIGSGSGMTAVEGALMQGKTVALVDKGPLGGTCLNTGCIPSKMLIYPADRVVEIQQAQKLGISAQITGIDFSLIMKRMRQEVDPGQAHMRRGIQQVKKLDFYEAEGQFVAPNTLEVAGKQIKGSKIFIASGARPLIPKIEGIADIAYLTNETIFSLKKLPKSIIIIGGGYIAVEFGHFFAAMGSQVTILGRNKRLIPHSEPEISDLLLREMSKRMTIYTDTEAVAARKTSKGVVLTAKNRTSNEERTVEAETVLVAAGRTSNADILQVEKTGVEIDNRGYIKVDEYLQTSQPNIWAWGDAIGKYMFRHVANTEADIAWHNAHHQQPVKMDYHAIPYAVFCYPQVATVGLTEAEAKKQYSLLVGSARYHDVAKGVAMADETSFAKAIVEKNSRKIIGFHIIGPHASILIQEVIDIMAIGGTIAHIAHGMHIHPALPEVILRTLGNLQEVTEK